MPEAELLDLLAKHREARGAAPVVPPPQPEPAVVPLQPKMQPALPAPVVFGPTIKKAEEQFGPRVHPATQRVLDNVELTSDMNPTDEAKFKAISQAANIPVEVARSIHPSMIDNWMHRQDVKFHLERAHETRKRMAIDIEAALVIRGIIPALAASEQALDRLGVEIRPPYKDYIREKEVAVEEQSIAAGVGSKLADSVIRFGTVIPMEIKRAHLIEKAADLERTGGEIVGDWWQRRMDRTGGASLVPDPGDVYDVSKRLITWMTGAPEDVEAHRAEALEISRRLVTLYKLMQKGGSTYAKGFFDRIGSFDPEASEGDKAVLMLKAIGDMPGEAVIGMVEVVAQQAVPLAAGMATTLLTRKPTAGILAATGGGYVQERFNDYNKDLIKKFGKEADLTTEAGMRAFIDDPKRQDFVKGIGEDRALVISVAALLGFKLAGARLAKGTLANALLQMPVQALAEGAGEAGGAIYSGQGFDSVETMLEMMGGFATAPIDVLIASRNRYLDRAEAKAAKAWLRSGEEVAKNIKGVAPETLATASEVLAARLKQEGVTTVYLSAEELIKFDQDLPAGETAAETLGLNADELRAAANDGRDVEIGAEAYVRHILGKEGFEALINHTRMTMEGMTPQEAQDFTESGAEGDIDAVSIQERLEASLGVTEEETIVLREDAEVIMGDVREQMTKLGRAQREADLNALLTSRRYVARAVRATKATGETVSALELYMRDNLMITDQEVEQVVFEEQIEQQVEQAEAIGIVEDFSLNQDGTPKPVKAPKKTRKVYKLFAVKPGEPGKLYPLFVGADKAVPVGSWVEAEIGKAAPPTKTGSTQVKSKLGPLKNRPGWHAGTLPFAHQIGSGGTSANPANRRPTEVWAEVEVADDVDWQSEATSRAGLYKASNKKTGAVKGQPKPAEAHITDGVPKGGQYEYNTSVNVKGTWVIAGEMKVNRVLSDAEVAEINEAGGGTHDLPRAEPSFGPDLGFRQDAAPSEGGLNDHLLKVERSKRTTGKQVTWFEGERERIAENAKELGIEAKVIEAHVRKRKLAHPSVAGWTPWVYNKTEVVEKVDKDGNVIPGPVEYDHQPKGQPYTFNVDDQGNALDKGSDAYNKKVEALAHKVRDEVLGIYRRSLNNQDTAALAIIRQAGWYKNMRVRLRREFGGLGDLFADLLGATSPNTPVRGNWDNAILALQLATRGDFDTLLPQWIEWAETVEQVQGEFKQWMVTELATRAAEAEATITDLRAALDAREVELKEQSLQPIKEAKAQQKAQVDSLIEAALEADPEGSKKEIRAAANADPSVIAIKDEIKALRDAIKGDSELARIKSGIKTARSKASKKAIKDSKAWKDRKAAMAEARELSDALIPLKPNGKKFGFNGRNVVRGLLDLWRVVKNADADIQLGGTKPKALNFSGNLIGFRERATIDVWAARIIQRLAKGNRIPSEAEQSVTGDMLESGETTAQFGMGQDVFSKAAKLIRASEEMAKDKALAATNDDDLQAIVWFLEKERWAKDDTTSAAGEGGSFEFEADLSGIADRDRVVELRKIIDSTQSTKGDRTAAAKELDRIKREVDRFYAGVAIQQSMETQGIDFLPTDGDMAAVAEELRTAIYEGGAEAVIASKAFSTEGRYGDPERSFDVEVVAREDYDVAALMDKVVQLGRDSKQDSVFVSRVLRADEDPDPLKHRPGIEVYFRDMKSLGEMQPILDELAEQGLGFYTVITDGRGTPEALRGEVPNAVGVRLQYVPEFGVRYDFEADLLELSDADLIDRMKAQAGEYAALADTLRSRVEGVSFAGMFWHETNVQFLHEYEGAQDADTEGTADPDAGRADQEAWQGRTVREGLAAADRQRREGQSSDAVGGQSTEDVTLEQTSQGQARGSFTPSSQITDQDGNPLNLIQIFERGDRSTFLHESGHFWLEQLKSDASQFGSEFQKDWDTVKKWWGQNADNIRAEAIDRAKRKGDKDAVAALAALSDAAVLKYIKSGDLVGSNANRYLSIAMHEQFARGTENYFRSGNAPSLALADAFVAFAVWVRSVYRSIQRMTGREGFDIQFSPEVTALMDRMLASDAEIEVASSQYQLASLFDTAEEAGMSKKQFAEHTENIAKEKEAAKITQLSKRVKEMERERLVWWKEEREELRDEVRHDVARTPAMRLIWATTQSGLADGSTVTAAEAVNRMDRTELKEFTEREDMPSLSELPKVGGRTIFEAGTKKNPAATMSPGMTAQIFEYATVEDMLLDLAAQPDYETAVEQEMDRRMTDKHGSIDDGAIDEAVASIHEQDGIAKMLVAELAALRTTEKAIKPKFVKIYAAKKISEAKMGEVSPRSYLAAEKRHAKEAGRALKRGDRAGAYKHQFQRLVNHYMAAEAQKIKGRMAKQLSYMRQFKRTRKKWPSIDADYVDAIRTKVSIHDFTARLSEKRRIDIEQAAFAEFLKKAQDDDGAIFDIPEWIKNKDRLVHFNDLSVGEFNELHDSIKQLEKQGRNAKKWLRGVEDMDRDMAVAQMLTSLNKKPKAAAVKARGKHIGIKERPASIIAGLDAALLKIEFMLEMIDGEPLGAWHQSIYQPFAEAEAQKQDLTAEVADLIHKRMAALPKSARKGMGKRVHVGEMAGTDANPNEEWHRGNLIMLALNVGNDSNLDKVIRGEEQTGRVINEELIDAALAQLTKEEWDFVQDIWDHAEKLWPTVEQIYRKEYGRVPDRVDPREVHTDHGTYRGGYFPLMYDRTRSPAAANIENMDALEAFQSENVRASVNSSMTKERSQHFAAPVDLDIQKLGMSFDRTIHFISHYDAVRNANRILAHPELKAAMQLKLGPEYVKSLTDWVGSIAANGFDRPPVDDVEKVVGWLSRNTTVAVLGASHTTLMAQILGYTTAIDLLMADGTYVADLPGAALDLGRAMGQVMSKEHRAAVRSLSGEMRHRLNNTDRDLRSGLRALEGKTGLRARIAEYSMLSIGAMQLYTVDFPVWTAAYNRAMREEQGNVDKAVKYADRVVRQSQSSGTLKDLAAVQRNKGYGKLITMFYSFFSVMYAILRSIGHEVVLKNPTSIPRMLARLTVVLTLSELGYGLMKGEVPQLEPEDEDEDGALKWLAKKTLSAAAGTIPFGRDIVEGALDKYGYSMSPTAMFGESVAKSYEIAANALDYYFASDSEEEPPELKDIKPLVLAMGILLKLPAIQANRTLSGFFALVDGEEGADFFDLLTGYKPEE